MVSTPLHIGLALAVAGLFSSIYHPVGIPWLIRHTVSRGTALGINGFFGGIGPGIAAIVAGVLVDWLDWRAAFIGPGAVLLIIGVTFTWLVTSGRITKSRIDRKQEVSVSRKDMIRAFLMLAVTMLCTGIIYQPTQSALPKVFSEKLGELTNDGVLGVSMFVAIVYLVAGGMQIIARRLAYKFPLKYAA
jgi:FSR family fosmidomycin resistance protein-like MFS transporter